MPRGAQSVAQQRLAIVEDINVLTTDQMIRKYNPHNYEILKRQDGILEPPPVGKAARKRRANTVYGSPIKPSVEGFTENWGRRLPRFDNGFQAANEVLKQASVSYRKRARKPKRQRAEVSGEDVLRKKKKPRLYEVAKAAAGGWTPPESDEGGPAPGEDVLPSRETEPENVAEQEQEPGQQPEQEQQRGQKQKQEQQPEHEGLEAQQEMGAGQQTAEQVELEQEQEHDTPPPAQDAQMESHGNVEHDHELEAAAEPSVLLEPEHDVYRITHDQEQQGEAPVLGRLCGTGTKVSKQAVPPTWPAPRTETSRPPRPFEYPTEWVERDDVKIKRLPLSMPPLRFGVPHLFKFNMRGELRDPELESDEEEETAEEEEEEEEEEEVVVVVMVVVVVQETREKIEARWSHVCLVTPHPLSMPTRPWPDIKNGAVLGVTCPAGDHGQPRVAIHLNVLYPWVEEPRDEVVRTLVHEMVHAWQQVHCEYTADLGDLITKPGMDKHHGYFFCRAMKRTNKLWRQYK
ncbi:hypothetical protein B0A55_04009 [Friedmanniomyces simplex]|uniref:SprT-like domain-containing protein n=1 Tax=Friedmanniomyces simplex TaxID=329884 RepID=A0A4U0XQ26_9PEZI|nr:hypothetical protein B0A55_04009 [Friedmanniomyces simplex]